MHYRKQTIYEVGKGKKRIIEKLRLGRKIECCCYNVVVPLQMHLLKEDAAPSDSDLWSENFHWSECA